MADESLRALFGDMEAEEAEMERYRIRLAPKLGQSHRYWGLIPGRIAVAAALALAVFLTAPGRIEFSLLSMAEIHDLALRKSPDMIEKARRLVRDGKGDARWNAILFISLTETGAAGADYVTQGIREDPRPWFRSEYLELLLDRADQYRYNRSELEGWMDREYDSTCLHLFRELVRVACLQERYFGPVAEQHEGEARNSKI